MSVRTSFIPAKVPRSRSMWLHMMAWGVVLLCFLGYVGRSLFGRYQRSALYEASERGDNARLQMLFRLGADPNLVERPGEPGFEWCPLVLAARNSKWSTVHLLLNAGAKADFPDMTETALEFAVRAKNLAEVRELLKHHAHPDLHPRSPTSLLEEAVESGEAPIVAALLEAGANPALCGDSGLGARYNRLDMVKLLLAHGADVNVHPFVPGMPLYREGGYTPLMWSVLWGNKEMTQFLLAQGASPNVKWTPIDPSKHTCETPLRMAMKAKRPDIVDLLRHAGEKE